jgi:8-oxo-dGTP pyrophosphatase MutT (NUDIX family)
MAMDSKPTVKTRSAGVVIVRKKRSRWLYLLLRAYDYWDFPKGRRDLGERLLNTAKREVREETGLKGLMFRWGTVFTETEPYKQGKVARYYVAETDREKVVIGANPEDGRVEHQEFRWMTYTEARARTVPRIRKVLAWARAVVSSKR